MARQLWLLRHAEAESHGVRPDAQRRLTQRGEHQARLAGRALGRMGLAFEAVLSSPKERALRTATLALAGWAEVSAEAPERPELHAPLAEGFVAADALRALQERGDGGRLLLVGHEPDLSEAVAALSGACIDLKKSGLAVVRVASAERDSADAGGELVLLLRPAELALIADLATVEL
jgi:phosphohistidine phosphatase